MAKRNSTRAARAAYPSDLTDAQWALIAPLIPPAEPGGREREVDLHEIFNGILYVLRSGCSWRMLPHDLPPWGTVHYETGANRGQKGVQYFGPSLWDLGCRQTAWRS